MDKRFLATLAIIIVALGGIFWFTKSSDNKANPNGSGSNKAVASNHTFGEGKKGVTLIEYGDLQCPACGQYYPIVKQVKEKYKSDITFQFRHFPLVSIHPHAMEASRAAEAAGLQGKFWEMHDMLYEQQQSWTSLSNVTEVFNGFAGQLGLNVEQFKKDYASSKVLDIINADIAAGQAIGANSTPTFVINGKKIEENPRDVEGFSKLIDEAIAKKSNQ